MESVLCWPSYSRAWDLPCSVFNRFSWLPEGISCNWLLGKGWVFVPTSPSLAGTLSGLCLHFFQPHNGHKTHRSELIWSIKNTSELDCKIPHFKLLLSSVLCLLMITWKYRELEFKALVFDGGLILPPERIAFLWGGAAVMTWGLVAHTCTLGIGRLRQWNAVSLVVWYTVNSWSARQLS